MKDSLHKKRFYFAWFLLLALCLQRIIGLVGSEIVYAIEVERNMNKVEEAIAEKIKNETGFDLFIANKDKNQMEQLENLGYSAPFIFSENIDSQLYYYTVDISNVTTFSFSKVDGKNPDPTIPFDINRSFKDRLFSDFYFSEPNLLIKKNPFFNIDGTAYLHSWKDPFISILSPPPKLT